jgi:uncharacterized membrane protein
VAAAVANFMKRSAVRGTWLDTHFTWQLRTAGWMALLLVLATVAFGSVIMALVGFPLLAISYVAILAWGAARIGRGWQALRDSQAITLAKVESR